jgi:hypothetical protein
MTLTSTELTTRGVQSEAVSFRAMRRAIGLTIPEVECMAELGTNTLQLVESGKRRLTPYIRGKLLEFFARWAGTKVRNHFRDQSRDASRLRLAAMLERLRVALGIELPAPTDAPPLLHIQQFELPCEHSARCPHRGYAKGELFNCAKCRRRFRNQGFLLELEREAPKTKRRVYKRAPTHRRRSRAA